MRLPRTVWDFRELFEASENCLKLLRTVWDFRELFETSENCLRLPRTVWDLRKLFKTSENYLRFLRTAWDFRELFQASEKCLTLPRTMSNSENTSEETMQENSGLQEYRLKECCCFSYQQFPFFFRFSRRSLLFYS